MTSVTSAGYQEPVPPVIIDAQVAAGGSGASSAWAALSLGLICAGSAKEVTGGVPIPATAHSGWSIHAEMDVSCSTLCRHTRRAHLARSRPTQKPSGTHPCRFSSPSPTMLPQTLPYIKLTARCRPVIRQLQLVRLLVAP